MNKTKQLQRIGDEFFAETGRMATKKEIARWAMATGRWVQHPDAALNQCASEIARAMSEQSTTDAEGRRVRVKHCAKVWKDGRQQTLWADMDLGMVNREFMELAASQRRSAVAADLYRLKTDVDSFNDHKNKGEPIQVPLDFTPDIEEFEEMAKSKRSAA